MVRTLGAGLLDGQKIEKGLFVVFRTRRALERPVRSVATHIDTSTGPGRKAYAASLDSKTYAKARRWRKWRKPLPGRDTISMGYPHAVQKSRWRAGQTGDREVGFSGD
jgi:hypothetical protein